jgi:dTDP-4-amino-4,6-dideoxygalactose transaminase
MPTVPVFKPFLDLGEIAAAQASLERGWLGMGSDVAAFESTLACLVSGGERKVAAVSTGHAALHLALLLAGVGHGHEVITPSFNNIADLQAILATGARPVFCDIDEQTLCVNPARIEALLGHRTRAIIAMDYACNVCNHDEIAEIARRFGLRVIHDAAHSLGSKYNGRPVGSFSDITTFSFDPVKTITTIDGGAILVRTDDELSRVHEMRLIGMGQPTDVMYKNQRAWTYDVRQLGFRYHMANLHAAIGVEQLSKFDQIAETRRRSFARYDEHLRNIEGIVTPRAVLSDTVPFIYYICVLGGRREELREHLANRGIDNGIHWQPGHWFSLFADCRRDDLANTERIGRQILTLPFHSGMDDGVQDRVIEAVQRFSW